MRGSGKEFPHCTKWRPGINNCLEKPNIEDQNAQPLVQNFPRSSHKSGKKMLQS
jgi:hypothetical protein